jgi:saposin
VDVVKLTEFFQVCTELGLCKKAAAAAAAPTKSAQECALCEFAITTLDNILGDRKSAEAVKEALDELCSYLPKTVTAQCVKYVDTYSEMIIDLISHDLPPQQVQ